MPRNFFKKNPDPRTTRTKTIRTQIQEHKPITQNTEDKNTNTRTQIQEHKTQTDLQQEHKYKPNSRSLLSAKHKNTNRSPARTQTQTQQKISRQPNTKKKTHTQKLARKHIPKNQQEFVI